MKAIDIVGRVVYFLLGWQAAASAIIFTMIL